MYEIKLKDVDTGEIFSFFGRNLADVGINLRNPTRRGHAVLYQTEALRRRIPNTDPGYVVAIDAENGAVEIRKLSDNFQVQKFFEWVLEDGMAAIENRHPLFPNVLEILRNAMANDLDLTEVYERVAEKWTDLKLEKKKAAKAPAPFVPTGDVKGYFEDFKTEHLDDPALVHPTI